jgi:hypothetical protein
MERIIYHVIYLTKNDYWSDNLNENIIPIIPVQQAAEMNQFLSGKKHIVYDKIGLSYEDNWLICCEQIMFTYISTSVSEINEIRNYMTDEFRSMDESARDINKWTGLSDKFKFHQYLGGRYISNRPIRRASGILFCRGHLRGQVF